jgi:hypothetical protein
MAPGNLTYWMSLISKLISQKTNIHLNWVPKSKPAATLDTSLVFSTYLSYGTWKPAAPSLVTGEALLAAHC